MFRFLFLLVESIRCFSLESNFVDSSVQYKAINFSKSVYFHCVVNYKPCACTVVCVLTSQFTQLLSVFEAVRGKCSMECVCVGVGYSNSCTPSNSFVQLCYTMPLRKKSCLDI